jgi:hypothetical protein
MIEKDYRAWIRTGSPLEAARDPRLWQHARRAEKAWHAIRRHGVADGPAAAATRYRELADAAQALADGYTVTLPSSALPPLLDLAEHAWKHSTRLHATARAASARGGSAPTLEAERDIPRAGDAYGALPDGLATVTRQAHVRQHRQPHGSARISDDQVRNRNVATSRHGGQQEDSRELASVSLRCRNHAGFPRSRRSTSQRLGCAGFGPVRLHGVSAEAMSEDALDGSGRRPGRSQDGADDAIRQQAAKAAQ